jgi:hypothetical protein
MRNGSFQVIKTKVIGLVVAGFMLSAASAQAAVLSVIGGDNTQTIESNFSLTAQTGLAIGAPLIAFNTANAATGGLFLSGPGTLSFEYLGKEAAFTNVFYTGGSPLFTTASVPGTTSSSAFPSGLVDFVLTTSGGGLPGAAVNGGPITGALSFAFAAVSSNSVILLFNDGGFNDTDRDDLALRVSVSQVPLPAAAWLLLSAILGLVSFSRIRRKSAQTA